MEIRARLENEQGRHTITLSTNGQSHSLSISPKQQGLGSSVNGGELLALALATCYCNDLYREAAARGITLRAVQVEVDALFGAAGEAARKISYRARVDADADDATIHDLLVHTDRVAEVHNTLRGGIEVQLERPAIAT